MPETKRSIKDFNESFLKELERLNADQQEAVDHIEGPVLVIAGPGTGKTHILTARIGRILMETDTLPKNILCLTFTEAGVHAMRERLLEFIGPEAHRVHIYTFHSFCNNIIQENLELFGRQELEPLSELERVEVIRKILDDLPVDHSLKQGRADIYFYEEHLYDLFKRIKSENWRLEDIKTKIKAYLDDLPNRAEFVYKRSRGEFKKGDLKRAKIEEIKERMERLWSAAELYPKYVNALRKAARYDFEDMILWVLQAFDRNEALLRTYQEQYLYFLVDEYQDTNGAQNKIIHQLVSYWEDPNVFIVGDDDQSIYEFQGARLKNLTDFYQHYQPELKLVLLKNNYRSSQSILDTSKFLIDQNQNRILNKLTSLGIEKSLIASGAKSRKSKLLPQVWQYANRAQEESDIVAYIEALWKDKYPLEEIAIIYAKHKQARNIINLFEKKGIPYHTRRKVNILDLTFIRNLVTLLEYIHLESKRPNSGEYLLFQILHFDFLNLNAGDLSNIGVYLAQFDWQDKPSWRSVLGSQKHLQRINLKDEKAIIQFHSTLLFLLESLQNQSLLGFLERLINRTGLLKYIVQHPEKLWLLQVLKSFFDFVQKESDRNPRLTLKRLLDILDRMDDNRLGIEVLKTIRAQDGINLITAHSAKGLEFQQVILIDCVKDGWEPRSRRSAFRFPIPDTLSFSGEEDALEARRRLFYVGMTRAKEQLYLTYSEQNNAGKSLQRTIFIDEILERSQIEIQSKVLSEQSLYESHLLQLTENQPVNAPTLDKAVVNELLEGFTLSVSAMNRYLKCPLSFYYESVLKVPSLMSEAASYGTAMHNSLQRLFEKMLLSKNKVWPKLSVFLQLFEYEMQKLGGYFSRKEYFRRLEMGKHNLTVFYKENIRHWHKKVKVEYNLKNVEVDGVPLNGTIDKLEFHGAAKAKIIDYKTGSQDAGKLRRPSKANPLGGSYWRQLVFYKILFESYNNQSRLVDSGTIVYLEPDSKQQFLRKTISYQADDVKRVRQLIKETYTKIMQHNFYEGCGEAHCSWCNFVKNNVMVNSFSEAEIEALDD